MALIVADRVQELTTTSGTGTLTLNGAVSGFQTFSNGIGNTNTTYYTIYDPTAYVWEVGIGTVGAGTLSRDTVLANSLGTTAKINLAGNQSSVFCTYPADKSVNLDASGNVTPLGTISSGIWQGTTVGVAYGGTGVTSSSGANSVVLRDSNQNITANRINQSNTNTTAAGGTTVLTAASSYSQTLTGTGNQTYTMPDATTLTTGVDFVFNNNATGLLTIRDAASGLLGTVTAGGATAIMLLDNGTVAGTWNIHGFLPESVTWGTNALDLGTTIVSNGTWQGGTIQSGYGGTGLTTFVAANNALFSTSASALTAGTLPILAGGTGATTAPNARTNLGATTVGGNLFTLTNPSAITFPRFNADNTVSALNATDFRTAIGAGTGSGDVVGPASATDNAIARFDGTTGKLIQNSAVTIADDGATVIDVNSTSDALRITQTGTGNAILVEDSANPDATPFVVDQNGLVLVGNSTTRGGLLQLAGSTSSSATTQRITGFAFDSRLRLGRANAAETVVASGDSIGILAFDGYDGTAYVPSAQISAVVDNTPGTNDMPGRLVFSTTADGASSPTERMRIDSAGQVGIGTTSLTGYGLRVGKNITGATSAFGVQSNGAIQSDVTTGAFMFRTAPTTQNATFTLPTLAHYDAAQGAFGASSTVTNQYGFIANASLTGATNNYGFFSNIASGTGRWNFFANGTANNAFAGNSSFGTIAAPTVAVDVVGTVQARPAATQDAVAIAGRAGGTGSFVSTITPTTLTASRTITLPNSDINFTTGLPVANGGTGTTSLTANNVILGNGTSAVQFVAPGANGNVLTSNGTTWTSAPPTGGGMVYPGAGIPNSTGSAWGTSYSTSGSGTVVPLATGASLSGVTLNDGYTEEVFAITDGASVVLSPTNGSIQTWTLGASRTPTQGTWAAGQSITLMINDTASLFQVTWTSIPVTWVGGSAPTLAPGGGFTVITLWKVGTTVYGALVGQVA